MKTPRMSVKRETFRANLLKGMTQTAAYMDAYQVADEVYASKAASRLMRKEEMVEAIAAGQTKVAVRAEIDAATIIRRLTQIAIRATKDKQYAAATSAYKLIGQNIGMFRENITQNFNFGFTGHAGLDVLPDMELEMLIAARLKVSK